MPVQLPLWFLIVSLFLPRISLLAAYFLHDLAVYNLSGWIPPILGVLIPRILVLILIYQDRGMSAWLLVHGFATALAYSGTGHKTSRRVRRAQSDVRTDF